MNLNLSSPITFKQAYNLQVDILNNKISTQRLAGMFKELETRDLTAKELLGFYRASTDLMKKLPGENSGLLDTCGTGGDGQKTFNISTLAAIICAACGVKVAKHGNRSSSGLCGSADVLAALGVNINMSPEKSQNCLNKCGITFMLAPIYHPAFAYARDARKLYGKKTYFNILGPLLNPAFAEYRLIGAGDDKTIPLMLKLLGNMKIKKAWIVRSQDGLDEISPCGISNVYEISKNAVMKQFKIDPARLGFSGCKFKDLQITNTDEIGKIFMDVLKGNAGNTEISAVVLNSAAGLVCAGVVKSIKQGIKMASEVLDSGKAMLKFNELKEFSNDDIR